MEHESVKRKEIEEVYGNYSPFELKNKLISLAKDVKEDSTRILLDAGRGNPNWIAAAPREAFYALGHFALAEARRVWNEDNLAGMPDKKGIYNRFLNYFNEHKNDAGLQTLYNLLQFCINELNLNPDDLLHEFVDGIIGDNYPVPDRILRNIEKILHEFLLKELGSSSEIKDKFDIFAVEGATAAMCYIFDSLIANMLLHVNDKIAIMTPIFTPYLEIPHLKRYDFEVIEIKATETTKDGTHTWQYPNSELDKLKDKSIKALFVVNPSNPPSVAMRRESIDYIADIVKNNNNNLIIISDEVYCTFVENFYSLTARIPYNTIGVYSFSKHFGVTGWRLGVIYINRDNIFDKQLCNLPPKEKEDLIKRYESLSKNPCDVPFIDRIVADSRQVALNHTAGLSTPQQVQMALFALFDLWDKENKYKNLTRAICHRRQKLLFNSLGLSLRDDPYDAAYYTEFDLLEWAKFNFGDDFAAYLKNNHKPIEILFKLAEESSIVLLSGGGFHAPEWSIRISLANLNDEAYSKIGEVLHKILHDYAEAWKSHRA